MNGPRPTRQSRLSPYGEGEEDVEGGLAAPGLNHTLLRNNACMRTVLRARTVDPDRKRTVSIAVHSRHRRPRPFYT